MTDQQQQALDSFYALDNVITVEITMPKAEWDAVRNEEPRWAVQLRMDRRRQVHMAQGDLGRDIRDEISRADQVHRRRHQEEVVLRLDRPATSLACTSISASSRRQRPRDRGPDRVALRDAQQLHSGRSYIKQTLGYRMLGMAGLPNSRCNYARVFVNGTPVGQGIPGVNSPGIFVNAEPVMKRYIERNFNGNMKGNLYELEHTTTSSTRDCRSSAWRPSPNSRTRPI